MANSDIEFFSYSEKDFHFKIQSKNEDSKFDDLLKKKWLKVEQDNLLRYSVKTQQSKILEGNYGFYVQVDKLIFKNYVDF
jgi:hypothetical protein